MLNSLNLLGNKVETNFPFHPSTKHQARPTDQGAWAHMGMSIPISVCSVLNETILRMIVGYECCNDWQ